MEGERFELPRAAKRLAVFRTAPLSLLGNPPRPRPKRAGKFLISAQSPKLALQFLHDPTVVTTTSLQLSDSTENLFFGSVHILPLKK